MKKCTQCGQTLSDDTKFCFKCGASSFEPVTEAGAYQPTYQQTPYQQTNQQTYYQSQQGYPTQPVYDNNEPVTVGNFVVYFLLMCIPIFNIVYFIMVAVGGPKYKKSLTNFARASLIWGAIVLVIYLIFMLIFRVTFYNMFETMTYSHY